MIYPNNNNNKKSGDEVIAEEPNDVQKYISQFFFYLHQETGFTKKSFTAEGLEGYVKNTAKNCFRLQIVDDLLQSVIRIAQIFSKTINDNAEKAVEIFVMILHKITNFFVKYWLGRAVLMVAGAEMSAGMIAFLISLYMVVCFVVEKLSFTWFLKLKDWILTLFSSETVRCFFEEIFPNYGRALLMA